MQQSCHPYHFAWIENEFLGKVGSRKLLVKAQEVEDILLFIGDREVFEDFPIHNPGLKPVNQI